MLRVCRYVALVSLTAGTAAAQCNCNSGGMGYGGMAYGGMTPMADYSGGMAYGDMGYGGMDMSYLGAGSVGSSEPLFEYDDPEPWKHGYLQIMPFYGGYHSGRPYNYHHVFSQTQTSVGWGMPHGMPYSQQWWHRYEAMADPGRALTEPEYFGAPTPTLPAAPVYSPALVPMTSLSSPAANAVSTVQY